MHETKHISEVCKMLDTTSRTIRYYEQLGLIHSTRETPSAPRRLDAENIEQLTRLSRRKPESLAKWALFENMQTPHSAVSLNHTETVEFRFFQSTLHPELLFESIRLTNDLCSLAAEHDKQTV